MSTFDDQVTNGGKSVVVVSASVVLFVSLSGNSCVVVSLNSVVSAIVIGSEFLIVVPISVSFDTSVVSSVLDDSVIVMASV